MKCLERNGKRIHPQCLVGGEEGDALQQSPCPRVTPWGPVTCAGFTKGRGTSEPPSLPPHTAKARQTGSPIFSPDSYGSLMLSFTLFHPCSLLESYSCWRASRRGGMATLGKERTVDYLLLASISSSSETENPVSLCIHLSEGQM